MDNIERYLHEDGLIRASVIRATDVIEEMRKTLNSFDLATIIAGRAMMGALLMASHLKKGENVGVYMRGNGPLGTVFAEGDHSGATRAYVSDPQVQLPLKEKKLDISGAVGIGILEVIRGSNWSDFLQKGAVELQTGHVGDDIAYYLYQSHQIPAIVGLSVELNPDGSVKNAGGILVELMPGADEVVIKTIEEKIKTAKSIYQVLSASGSLRDILDQYLSEFKMVKLNHTVEIKYQCRCSLDRVKKALFLLGHEELDSMITSGEESQEVSCDFCGKKYTLTIDELKDVRQKAFKSTLN